MKKVLFILGILSDADIEWILNNGVREKINPGKVLIHEGEPISSIYIVLDGIFSVTVAGLGHKEVAQLGVGEMIGEISFVQRGMHHEMKNVEGPYAELIQTI